jgi:hypothetical protein
MAKFFCVRLMLVDQFDGDSEGARHVCVVGGLFVVAIQLIVDGADFECLRLQRDADGNLLPLAHGHYPHLTLRTVVLAMRNCRLGATHPITFSARRQAAACGAGAGGSWGPSGGLSGAGMVSMRITDSCMTLVDAKEYLAAVGASRSVHCVDSCRNIQTSKL